MRMENRNVTFPQTKTILDGVNVPNVTLDDIQAILNMRDAWHFMLNTMDAPLTIEYLCSLNGYITRNEQPPIPSLNGAETELSDILSDSSTATEKALNLFTWGARGQLFWDGNKRTSLMAANKVLISAGAGMLTITDRHMERFNDLLLDFYNTGEGGELMRYLYDNAIQGIEL